MNSSYIRETLNNIQPIDFEKNPLVNLAYNKIILSGYGCGDSVAKFIYYLSLYRKLGNQVEYSNLSSINECESKDNVVIFVGGKLDNKISSMFEQCTIVNSNDENPIKSFLILSFKANEIIKELTGQAIVENYNCILGCLKKCNTLFNQIDKQTSNCKKCKDFDFIADGAQGAVAEFARMVLAREYGRVSMMENSEDFHHINIFHRNLDDIYTIIVGESTSKAYSRVYETIKVVDCIGRENFVISDKDVDFKYAGEIFKTSEEDYIKSSFMDFILTVYLACKLAEKQ